MAQDTLTVETLAFSAFLRSHDELTAYCILTQSPGLNTLASLDVNEIDLEKLPEQNRVRVRHLLRISRIGKSVATNLAVVYLSAIMEAYVKDALIELFDRRIRRINYQLIGQPVPTDEQEDITIEIELEEAEQDKENPFYIFSVVSRDYIASNTYRNTVAAGIGLLKKLFSVEIPDEPTHLDKWKELKALRNRIVHHRGYSRTMMMPFISKDGTKTIDEIVVSPEKLSSALDDIFRFAYAIETAIRKSIHNR